VLGSELRAYRVLRSAVAAVLVAACAAQTSSPAPTATAGATTAASPASLGAAPILPEINDAALPTELAGKLQAVLDKRQAARSDEPSVSAAVIVPGRGVWAGASGVADTAAKTVATAQTVYAFGSVTKLFVSGLTLLLVKDGVLELDDQATQWLDATAGQKANNATIRQLLTHRSGIASYTDSDPILTQKQAWTTAQLLDLVGAPHFAAGSQEEYSNTNYVLLGLIVERAGKAPLENQLRKRILGAYGLKRTYLSGREKAPAPLAHGYGQATQLTGDLYDGSGYLPNEALATGAWAAGAIASTPSDVARFLYLLGSGAVLGNDLTANALEYDTQDDYGLAFERGAFPSGGLALGHVGGLPGYVALAFYMVDNGNVVVVVTNTDVDDLYLVLTELSDTARQG
jgi:D-alanyl-D-alanine carboxypeptidase